MVVHCQAGDEAVTSRGAGQPAPAFVSANRRPGAELWEPLGGYAALATNPTDEGLQEVSLMFCRLLYAIHSTIYTPPGLV